MNLPLTMAPFILRGVTLHGVESVFRDQATRVKAYERMATDLDRAKLGLIAGGDNIVGLEQVVGIGKKILAGQVTGRYVVDVNQ
jgi:acrylyl-CoA reductase (NADPH)